MSRRYVSLEEAQTLIPRLTPIVSRSVQLHQHLRARVHDLEKAGYTVTDQLLGANSAGNVPEAEDTLAEARGLYQAVLEEVRALGALGAELKGPALVDFWSWLDGELEVLLCWQLGEREIAWYHTPEAGFAGRKPVSGQRFAAARDG